MHGKCKGLRSKSILPKGGGPFSLGWGLAGRVSGRNGGAPPRPKVRGAVGDFRVTSPLPGPGGDPGVPADHRALGKCKVLKVWVFYIDPVSLVSRKQGCDEQPGFWVFAQGREQGGVVILLVCWRTCRRLQGDTISRGRGPGWCWATPVC